MLVLPAEDAAWWASFVSSVRWKEAKSYSGTTPHSYTIREWDEDETRFEDAVAFIRTFGKPENFYRKTYIYFYFGDYKYWTMGASIEETTVINRAAKDTFYGRQFDYSGEHQYNESVYDRLAPVYDARYSTEECLEENEEVFAMVKELTTPISTIFDIGCGTGIALDYLHTPSVCYLGIDPSQGMKNEFIRKHPMFEFVQTTFEDAKIDKYFDVVISLFGSPSYIDPSFYGKIRTAADDYFLMFYKDGYKPDYQTDAAIRTDWRKLNIVFGAPYEYKNFLIYSSKEKP